MKNLLLSLTFLCLTQLSMAQKIYAWADVGLKAGYGLTGLLNTNLFNASDYDYQLATGSTFGGKVGLFFGLFNGQADEFTVQVFHRFLRALFRY